MKHAITIVAAALMTLSAAAQVSYQASFAGELHGREGKGFAYQGMDVYKKYLVSGQNQGVATIYKFDGKKLGEAVGQFELGSFNKDNHANVMNFGTQKYSKKDPFPLLYVSQAQKKTINGLKDVLYVERIAKDMKSSTTVQTIVLDDPDHLFGYALQWALDNENGYLYGFGNTVSNMDPANKHRIIKFRMPELSDSDAQGMVHLNPADALENYLIEDVNPFRGAFIGQGLNIKNGKLYMPTGVGTDVKPSILYIWDLETKSMDSLDLSHTTHSELEDSGWFNDNTMAIQSQDGIFVLKFQK